MSSRWLDRELERLFRPEASGHPGDLHPAEAITKAFDELTAVNDRLKAELAQSRETSRLYREAHEAMIAKIAACQDERDALKAEYRLSLSDVLAALPPGASVTFTAPKGT